MAGVTVYQDGLPFAAIGHYEAIERGGYLDTPQIVLGHSRGLPGLGGGSHSRGRSMALRGTRNCRTVSSVQAPPCEELKA